MIIYSRKGLIASVNIYNQVHIDMLNVSPSERVLPLSSQEAIAFAQAILKAAEGKGEPCGKHNPLTTNDETLYAISD